MSFDVSMQSRTSPRYTTLDSRIRENDGKRIDQEKLEMSETWFKT